MEQDLKTWFCVMCSQHPGLSFRFEYVVVRGIWLVSYRSIRKIGSHCHRNLLLMEDWFAQKYGSQSPLFCEDERLFRLSSRAKEYV